MDATLLENLRLRFNQKYSDNVSAGLYDSQDVDRLMTSNEYAEAFLRHQKSVAHEAADMAHRALKWRKEYGLNNLTDADFPEELLTKGAMFFRSHDKEGNPIMHFRIKEHKKNAQTLPVIMKYMVYLIDREDKRVEGRQCVILFDMTGAGVSNLDMELIKFLITCFEEYLPDHLAYLLVFDMPWILGAAWKIIRTWLSEDAKNKVVFVRGQEIFKHIDKFDVLVHMGGLDDYKFVYEPMGKIQNGSGENGIGGNENQNYAVSTDMDEVCTTPLTPETPMEKEHHKHVTFSSEDPSVSVYTSMLNDSTEAESDPTGSPASKPSPENADNLKMKIPFKPKSKLMLPIKDESTFVGTLITIEPGEELFFQPQTPTNQKGDSATMLQSVIRLTNPTGSLRTAYKVKTTSPEKYKVRPSIGLIKPGHGTEVTVYVISTDKHDVTRDKFLVMSMEVEDGFMSSGELAELWRTVSKTKVSEHRLRCSVLTPVREDDNKISSQSDAKLDEMQKLISSLNMKIDDVLSDNKSLAQQVQFTNRTQKLIVVLMFCFSLMIVFSVYQRLSAIEELAENSLKGSCEA